MSLSTLPLELLLMIAEQLEETRDVNSLARSNHRFHKLLKPLLYTLNRRIGDSSAVPTEIRNNNAATLRYALTQPQRSCYEFTLLSDIHVAFVSAAASNHVAVVEELLHSQSKPVLQRSITRAAELAGENGHHGMVCLLRVAQCDPVLKRELPA